MGLARLTDLATGLADVVADVDALFGLAAVLLEVTLDGLALLELVVSFADAVSFLFLGLATAVAGVGMGVEAFFGLAAELGDAVAFSGLAMVVALLQAFLGLTISLVASDTFFALLGLVNVQAEAVEHGVAFLRLAIVLIIGLAIVATGDALEDSAF